MHTWQTIGFLLFAAAAIVAAVFKSYPLALVAAGAACYVAPVVFT